MAKFLKQHAGSLLLSVLLHVALMGMLAVTVTFSKPKRTATRLAIEATVVDSRTLPEQRRRQEELERQREVAAREERERQAAEVKRQQEVAAKREAEELEKKAAEQAQQRKAVDDKRKAEETAKKKAAADKRQAEEAAKQQAAEQKRKAEEAAKRKREADARRKQEAEQARQEQLLRDELAREEELTALREGPLMSRYAQEIKARIERSWIRPLNAQEHLNCELHVTQTRNGDVIDVRVLKCNQDAVVVRSLEAAVLRASPLPEPPDPRLFSRDLILDFSPGS
jgi:colicin import membrane protein